MQESRGDLDYLVLRLCERLKIREEEFWDSAYDSQIRWLGYELQRESEEQPTFSTVPISR